MLLILYKLAAYTYSRTHNQQIQRDRHKPSTVLPLVFGSYWSQQPVKVHTGFQTTIEAANPEKSWNRHFIGPHIVQRDQQAAHCIQFSDDLPSFIDRNGYLQFVPNRFTLSSSPILTLLTYSTTGVAPLTAPPAHFVPT